MLILPPSPSLKVTGGRGDDNKSSSSSLHEHRTIADVLNEVNSFINDNNNITNTHDDNNDYNDTNIRHGELDEKDFFPNKPVDGEARQRTDLFDQSSRSKQQQQQGSLQTLASQQMVVRGEDGGNDNDDEDDAVNSSENLYESLSNRYRMTTQTTTDGDNGDDAYSSKLASSTTDNNNCTLLDNIGDSSPSANSSEGGSSVENMPPVHNAAATNNAAASRQKQQQHLQQMSQRSQQHHHPQLKSRKDYNDSSGGGVINCPFSTTTNVRPISTTHHRHVSSSIVNDRGSSSSNNNNNDDKNEINSLFGLQSKNCQRPVSLCLKVNPHPQLITTTTTTTTEGKDNNSKDGSSSSSSVISSYNDDEVDEDGYGPILYPSASVDELLHRGEVILVNPHAFDVKGAVDVIDEHSGRKNSIANSGSSDSMTVSSSDKPRGGGRISGRVTVETARLVAEVSQISSEDWARKYQFDNVCWPPPPPIRRRPRKTLYNQSLQMTTSPKTTKTVSSQAMMSALASTAVNKVLTQSRRRKDSVVAKVDNYDISCSTIIFTVGGSASGKTQTIFGSYIANLISPLSSRLDNNTVRYDNNNNCGLLGEIMNGILLSSQQQTNSSESIFECSISILEIVNSDVLRDILATSSDNDGDLGDMNGGSKSLRIRQVDARGAAVLNLHQVTIHTMEQLRDTLHSTFKSKVLRRAWNSEGGHGHFIITISIYRPEGYCGKIQLVDLSSPDRQNANVTTLGDVRKSLSALRGILRGLVTQKQQPNHHMNSQHLPYRESILTRLLQRSFDANTHSVVIGTVNTSIKCYNQTLSTMDFMSRILAKSGDTALSPFHDTALKGRDVRHMDRVNDFDVGADDTRVHSLDSLASQLSHSEAISPPSMASLKSYTSDPRQRLAKLLGSAPVVSDKGTTKPHSNVLNTSLGSDSVSFDNKSTTLKDKYGSVLVFNELDSLMDANVDNDCLDRNSCGDEMIIQTLTPCKSKSQNNDTSSVDTSEGVAPSPFRKTVRTDNTRLRRGLSRSPIRNNTHRSNQSDNVRLSQIKKRQQEDRRRLDELYDGVEYSKDTRSNRLLQNILFSSGDTATGSQSNQNDSSSRLSNDGSSSDESTYPSSLSQTGGEKFLPHIGVSRGQRNTIGVPRQKSEFVLCKPVKNKLNDGELSNDDSSRKCISESNQAKPQELRRLVSSSHDQPALNSMAPSSISMQSHYVNTDQQSEEHTDNPQMQVEDTPSFDYSGYAGHASAVDSSIFVGKSIVASPIMILPIDSMDSEEPLVSARGQATYFREHSPQNITQPLLPMESIDLPSSSPTYAMFESFVKEIDSLVTKLTPDKLEVSASVPITGESLPFLDNTRLESHFESVNGNSFDLDIEHPRCSLLEAEISSLTEKIQSLSNEIRESEIHHSKIRAILNEDDGALISSDVALSWTQTCDTLEDAIRKRKCLIVELESRLQSAHSERDNLSKELRQSQQRISDLSKSVQCIENDLVVAREAIDFQSTPLQSEIQRLKKQLKDLVSTHNASSDFFGRLDDLLGNKIDEAVMFDERQHKIRIDSIRDIMSQSQEVIIKLNESQMNVDVLESKNQELEEKMRMYEESQNQMESKMLESEKLAEEAIAASERIAGEAGEVQHELVMVQKAHQELLTAHSVTLEDRRKLSSKFERNAAQMVERESEILGLKDSIKLCHDERDQLKEQLSLVGAKTVEVMKHHVEGLKADYARRLESFKANYVSEIDNEGLAQLQLDLSKKEAENVSLRSRIEELSSKLSNVEEQLSQNQRELTSVSKETLRENEEKNAMKDELNHLRSLMDIAEESIGELNRLKEENQRLMDMIRAQNNDQLNVSSLDASYEIKGMSDNDHLMYERISTLMRENEHNNISMRTLQVSFEQR